MTSLVQPCVGSNGITVSNANASGGDQFNSVVTGASAVHTWDNAQTIHGNATSLLRTMPASVSTSISEEWDFTATANAYLRWYFYVTANPSVNLRQNSYNITGGALCCSLSLITTGVLRISDSAGTTVANTTGTVPLNAWMRVEFELTGVSGTTGATALRVYSGANLEGTTPDTGLSLSNSGVACAGQPVMCRPGHFAATTETAVVSTRMSDLAYSDVAQPGPLVAPALLPQQIRMRRPALFTRIAARGERAVYR